MKEIWIADFSIPPCWKSKLESMLETLSSDGRETNTALDKHFTGCQSRRKQISPAADTSVATYLTLNCWSCGAFSSDSGSRTELLLCCCVVTLRRARRLLTDRKSAETTTTLTAALMKTNLLDNSRTSRSSWSEQGGKITFWIICSIWYMKYWSVQLYRRWIYINLNSRFALRPYSRCCQGDFWWSFATDGNWRETNSQSNHQQARQVFVIITWVRTPEAAARCDSVCNRRRRHFSVMNCRRQDFWQSPPNCSLTSRVLFLTNSPTD